MPELPEVETIVRSLAGELAGRRVVRVLVRERRLRGGVARDFPARLEGRRFVRLARRGKYLLAWLDDGAVLLVHLGMTGQLTVAPASRPDRVHDHVVIRLDDGRFLTFNDARRFGRLAVIDGDALGAEAGGGLDPLADGFTADALFGLTRRRRTTVKALLMDQRWVSGLGNIYVNEILFHAAIRPGRRAGRLARADCERLVASTRRILEAAIQRGGSSISDYRDGLGRAGEFQLNHHVYDRALQPCTRCGAPIRRRLHAGRSSFYCSRCQR